MSNKAKISGLAAVALLLVLGLWSIAQAQTSPNYNLEWHLAGCAGGVASSARYRVNSAIGQSDSGQAPASSSNYRVEGGYIGGGGFTMLYPIYLPVLSRS